MLGNPIANIIILLELHLIHIKSHEIPLNHYEIPWKPLYNPIINPWNPYQILIFHGILPSSHGSLRFHPPRLCHLFPHQLRRSRGVVIRGLGVGGTVRGGAEPRAFQDTSGWKTIGKLPGNPRNGGLGQLRCIYLKTCIYKGLSFHD